MKNTSSNSDQIDEIFKEAETVKSLSHPNIVKIINFFVIKKTLQCFFIMEYLEGKRITQGGDLRELLEKEQSLSESDTLVIFKQILDAVVNCHNGKIVHRDLKLENIMKTNNHNNEIKIVDFGISGLCAGNNTEIIKAGSLNYLSPEILKGENMNSSFAMDVWALGCILYALVIGKLPFEDSKEVTYL